MKHFRTIMPITGILFSLLLLSCNKEKVSGSGAVGTETRSVSGFYSVSSFGSTEVFISKGNEFSVSVKGFENLVPHLKTFVQNGTLIIRFDNNVNVTNDNTEVYITMPSLTSVSGQGSGDIKVSGQFIGMDNFSATTSGSGDVEIENGNTTNFNAKISGSGDIESFGFQSQNTTISINGSGDAEVSVSKSLKATLSGSGNVYYKGNPEIIEPAISGSGQIIKQ